MGRKVEGKLVCWHSFDSQVLQYCCSLTPGAIESTIMTAASGQTIEAGRLRSGSMVLGSMKAAVTYSYQSGYVSKRMCGTCLDTATGTTGIQGISKVICF